VSDRASAVVSIPLDHLIASLKGFS
jgi:hypothetical protein